MMKSKHFSFGNFADTEREYLINGVVYRVAPRFIVPIVEKETDTITDKFEKFIGSDFAHLTIENDGNIIEAENISAAGKEV